MSAYPAIEHHGVIGDLRTAALVARDGTIDWCCLPRFDSPSCFAALLDAREGGAWRCAPTASWTSEQHYLQGTNVLVTAFRTPDGVADVTDFMPVGPLRAPKPRLYRRVRGVRGDVPMAVAWEPRFDYGLREARFVRRQHGVLATDRDDDVATLSAPAAVDWKLAEHGVSMEFTLHQGDALWLVMQFDHDEVLPVEAYRPDEVFEATTKWWDAWSSRMRYEGPFRRDVERSALALKLCCYEPTGAIVAAPTMSLPESLSGGRNWDYRYTWLRDSAFVLSALTALGYEDETAAFLDFLKRLCRREDARHLHIMYAVDGSRELPERTLSHLEGWRGIGPVLVGNGAAPQFQLDVYGEVLEMLALAAHREMPSEGAWKVLHNLVEWTAGHWHEPDSSIWEARLAPRHYTFSKIMAWVALDRAAGLARRWSLDGQGDRWRAVADAVRADVLAHGWDAGRATFTQAYGEPQLDAALLAVPKVGFLPPTDERVRTTLAAVRKELATPCEDLIYRYHGPDGMSGAEGAFLFTSFWMLQNLALIGEVAEAERLFGNLLRRASEVGLFAEEIDPLTNAHLGNFPQALSHAALVETAFVLERAKAQPA